MNRDTLAVEEAPHLKLLRETVTTIADRSVDYGDPAASYERAAQIASLLLGRAMTAHEVAMVLLSVKLSRIAETPDHRDSYLDGAAMLAFAAEFAAAGVISGKRLAKVVEEDPGPPRSAAVQALFNAARRPLASQQLDE